MRKKLVEQARSPIRNISVLPNPRANRPEIFIQTIGDTPSPSKEKNPVDVANNAIEIKSATIGVSRGLFGLPSAGKDQSEISHGDIKSSYDSALLLNNNNSTYSTGGVNGGAEGRDSVSSRTPKSQANLQYGQLSSGGGGGTGAGAGTVGIDLQELIKSELMNQIGQLKGEMSQFVLENMKGMIKSKETRDVVNETMLPHVQFLQTIPSRLEEMHKKLFQINGGIHMEIEELKKSMKSDIKSPTITNNNNNSGNGNSPTAGATIGNISQILSASNAEIKQVEGNLRNYIDYKVKVIENQQKELFIFLNKMKDDLNKNANVAIGEIVNKLSADNEIKIKERIVETQETLDNKLNTVVDDFNKQLKNFDLLLTNRPKVESPPINDNTIFEKVNLLYESRMNEMMRYFIDQLTNTKRLSDDRINSYSIECENKLVSLKIMIDRYSDDVNLIKPNVKF